MTNETQTSINVKLGLLLGSKPGSTKGAKGSHNLGTMTASPIGPPNDMRFSIELGELLGSLNGAKLSLMLGSNE